MRDREKKSSRPGTSPEPSAPQPTTEASVAELVRRAVRTACRQDSGTRDSSAGVVLAAIGGCTPRHLRAARELGDAIRNALPRRDQGIAIDSAISGPADCTSDGAELLGRVFGVLYGMAELVPDVVPDFDLDRLKAHAGELLRFVEIGAENEQLARDVIEEAYYDSPLKQYPGTRDVKRDALDFATDVLRRLAVEVRQLVHAAEVEQADRAEAER